MPAVRRMCPVHMAALESRTLRAPDPLLQRVTVGSATEECQSCALCQKALECMQPAHARAPSDDPAWTSLWTDEFRS